MKIQPFKLERYFAKYEFSAPYLLSCSDCEALTLKEVLSIADENSLKACDLYDNAISLFGMSKSFALAGLNRLESKG